VSPSGWRLERALARIEPTVETLLAEHATSYWGRPVRRHQVVAEPDSADRRVVWTIDNETVLEVRVAESGPAMLVVHDVSLFSPLRRALRTRHVRLLRADAEG
jgi:hypothetical protein